MSDESDTSTNSPAGSNTGTNINLEEMAQKRRAADLEGRWPHKCDVDFYEQCDLLGLCSECSCIDTALATAEEKTKDYQNLVCRCAEIDEFIARCYWK